MSGSTCLSLIIGIMRLRISFSQSFEKNGKRLIGRYEEVFSIGLSGLGNKTIIDSFHCRGK